MDPVSIIGFAASIITFVDFSWSLVTGSVKLYQSGSTEFVHLDTVVSDLQSITQRIPQDFGRTSIHECALSDLADECHVLAKKLTAILSKLKTSNGKSKWASLKVMWATMKNSDEIRSLETDLSRYQSSCLIRLNLILCERQSAVVLRLDQMQREGNRLSTETAKELKKLRNTISDALQRKVRELDPGRFVSDAISGAPPTAWSGPPPASQSTGDASLSNLDTSHIPEDVSEIKDVLLLLRANVQSLSMENQILANLIYDSIHSREDSIQNAEGDTFKWILDEPSRPERISNSELVSLPRLISNTQLLSPPRLGNSIVTPSTSWQRIYSDNTYLGSRGNDSRLWQEVDYGEPQGPNVEWKRAGVPVSPRPAIASMALPRSELNAPFSMQTSYTHREDVARSRSRRALRQWLRCGDGVFHISGRPGSGKSTLMKLVCQHPTTAKDLNLWAGGRHLAMAQFFFWNSGDGMQTSLNGLYRSILFETLRQCPDLIPVIFPEQWNHLKSPNGESSYGSLDSIQFRPSNIKSAFFKLVKRSRFPNHKLCIFIDGLDEYRGDNEEHYQLATTIKEWTMSPDVKICVSSRPYNEFMYTFSNSSAHRIHLHEITKPDIYIFCREAFQNCAEMKSVSNGEKYLDLVTAIVELSDGVFLWARLVVHLLLGSIRRRDSLTRLMQVLKATPRALNDLYEKIIGSVDPLDRDRCEQALLLTALNPFPEPLIALAYSWLDYLPDARFPMQFQVMTDEDIRQDQEDIRLQLGSVTKGLLEVVTQSRKSNIDSTLFFAKRVQFFHRTLRDYVRERVIIDRLSAKMPYLRTKESFARLRLAELVLSHPSQAATVWDTFANQLLDDLFKFLNSSDYPFEMKQIPCKIMNDLRDMVEQEPRAMVMGELRPRFYGIFQGSELYVDIGTELSFLHYACYHSQLDYIRSLGPSGISAVRQMDNMSLLLSASMGGNIDTIRLLIFYGFKSTDKVGSSSVWVIFLSWLLQENRKVQHASSQYWEILDILIKDGFGSDTELVFHILDGSTIPLQDFIFHLKDVNNDNEYDAHAPTLRHNTRSIRPLETLVTSERRNELRIGSSLRLREMARESSNSPTHNNITSKMDYLSMRTIRLARNGCTVEIVRPVEVYFRLF